MASRLKSIRKGHRSAISKIVNKFEDAQHDDRPHLEELAIMVDTLKKKQTTLADINEQIIQELDESDIESEITETEEYNFNLEANIRRIHNFIQTKSSAVNFNAEPLHQPIVLHERSSQDSEQHDTQPLDATTRSSRDREQNDKQPLNATTLVYERSSQDSEQEGATPVVVSKDESASAKVLAALHCVKVCKYDADGLQRELEGELFDKWSESCEVMNTKGIPVSKITNFLDHLQNAYEGVNHKTRQKLEGILFSESWDYRLYEWKFNTGADSRSRYGMIGFGKSPDRQYFDCMYVIYKMDFKITPTRTVTQKTHSWFWGLIKYTTEDIEVTERALGSLCIRRMENFFRVKALQGFYKEGLMDSINYVKSLEETSFN